MNGFGFIMTLFVIWFWLNPDSAGKWAAKAKRAFVEASNAE
nr:hypothetical protein [Brucella pseudintermedia]